VTQSKVRMFPTLHPTYYMLQCAFGEVIPNDVLPYVCNILKQKLSDEMIIDVLSMFRQELYMQISQFVTSLQSESVSDEKFDFLQQLQLCGYDEWSQDIIPNDFVPSYLMDIYSSIVCAYGEHIEEKHYEPLLAVLVEDMSFRSIARVLSIACSTKDYHTILNDAYSIEDELISENTLSITRKQLGNCGYTPD